MTRNNNGDGIHFTPTERRMVTLLMDGQGHRIEELRACLQDEYAETSTVTVHLAAIRAKLRPKGGDVAYTRRGDKRFYHLIKPPEQS